jgi:hypothetical protein
VKIGTKVTQDDHWQAMLHTVQSKNLDWQTRGCSIFGRTLIYNSCLLGKVWFNASQSLMSKQYEQKFKVRFNQYFRMGRRTANISLEKRELPKPMGGLGQIAVSKQIDLLRAKWVLRSLSEPSHLWAIYWQFNMQNLQAQLELHCPPSVADADWDKLRPSTAANAKVFPFVLAAYKSWHSLGYEIDTADFCTVASQPLFNNKYITSRLPVDGELIAPHSIKPSANVKRLLCHIEYMSVSDLFIQVSPAPTMLFDINCHASWRFLPRDVEHLQEKYPGLRFEHSIWESLIASIPPWVARVMAPGPPDFVKIQHGWGATEAPEGDPDPVADVYYFDKTSQKGTTSEHWNLYWYGVADDGITLYLQGYNRSLDQGWAPDWITSILPSMRPISVTLLTGTPRMIGWSDEYISPATFIVPVSKKSRPTIEEIVGSGYYLPLHAGTHPNDIPDPIKPCFSKLNKKLRRLGQKPLAALAAWPVTDTDVRHHANLKRRGQPVIDWAYRLKAVHNCPFLLPKYAQLIYWITSDTLKSGKWLIKSHITKASGMCPCCTTLVNAVNPLMQNVTVPVPASAAHMFDECLMAKSVWDEADQLGRSFWPEYENFNYEKDVTLLVHKYTPVSLFKMAVIWSLWRYWCEIFYERDNFSPERYSLIVPEIMLRVRDEMICRLLECRAVIQWLGILKDRRTDSEQTELKRTPEKQFLLVESQSVSANPADFDLPAENPFVAAWLGNNVMCYMRGPKLVFNHGVWYVYKDQMEELAPQQPQVDDEYDDDHEEEASAARSAAFLEMDY